MLLTSETIVSVHKADIKGRSVFRARPTNRPRARIHYWSGQSGHEREQKPYLESTYHWNWTPPIQQNRGYAQRELPFRISGQTEQNLYRAAWENITSWCSRQCLLSKAHLSHKHVRKNDTTSLTNRNVLSGSQSSRIAGVHCGGTTGCNPLRSPLDRGPFVCLIFAPGSCTEKRRLSFQSIEARASVQDHVRYPLTMLLY